VEGAWRAVQGGENAAARVNLPLFDIEADSSGSLWAVGDQGRIVQFDDGHWHEHDSGTTANLRSVLPLPDGRVLAGGSAGTVLLLENGSWSLLETGTGCPITSMACLGEDTVIAAGGEYDIESGQFRGRLYLFSEGHWQSVESEHPLPRLRRVRRFDDTLLICGDNGTAFRWNTEGVKRLPCRLRYDLHDILPGTDGSVLLCGDGGTLVEETAASATDDRIEDRQQVRWRQISDGETNRTLRTLWPVDKDRLIAAGDGPRRVFASTTSGAVHRTISSLPATTPLSCTTMVSNGPWPTAAIPTLHCWPSLGSAHTTFSPWVITAMPCAMTALCGDNWKPASSRSCTDCGGRTASTYWR
jgi:WD40 repeat protein